MKSRANLTRMNYFNFDYIRGVIRPPKSLGVISVANWWIKWSTAAELSGQTERERNVEAIIKLAC